MTVAVIADSAASLPPDVARQWDIRVVPLQVVVDGVARAEGSGIDAAAVLAALVSGAQVTTSQPTPEAYDLAFAQAAQQGAEGAVVVALAGTLSGTVEVARAAAARAPLPVEVVDTRTLAMAEGFAAIAAAHAARRGESLAAVAEAARATARDSRCMFTVETLDYLRRGGRISPVVAAAGKVLGIRPVLEIIDGEVTLVARVRSTARARSALLGMVEDAVAACEHGRVAVLGLGDPGAVDDAARAIEERIPDAKEVIRATVSAALAVHTGPGTLAAAVASLPPGDVHGRP